MAKHETNPTPRTDEPPKIGHANHPGMASEVKKVHRIVEPEVRKVRSRAKTL